MQAHPKMSGRMAQGGLSGEAGRSSINSPCKRANPSAAWTEAFRDKENLGAEARAASAASGRKLADVTHNHKAPASTDTCGRSAAGAGRSTSRSSSVAVARNRGAFAGGQKKVRQSRSCKTPLAARAAARPRKIPSRLVGATAGAPSPSPPQYPQLSPGSGPPSSDSTAAAWSSGGGGGVLGVTPYSRAARRVALRAARAKGGAPARTPAMLYVPSKLMESTAASRAGTYTPPQGDSSVRPRFVPRRRSVGRGGGLVGGGVESSGKSGAVSASESRRKAVVARTTSSSCAGRKRELQERRGLVLFHDEASPSPASGNDCLGSTGSSVDSTAAVIGCRDPAAWAGLMLLPPARCDDEFSRELEAKARRRSVSRGRSTAVDESRGGRWRRLHGASEGRLNVSVDTTEGEDEVLLSPCEAVGSLSSAVALSARVGGGDMTNSSLDSSWSMASVDETDREPNAREGGMSGGDPVARMLLGQSDGDDGFETPSPFGRLHNTATTAWGSTPNTEASTSFEIDVVAVGGREVGCGRREGADGGRASPTLFAAPRVAVNASAFSWSGRAAGAGGVGESLGGVFASVRREGLGEVDGGRDRLFKPIAFHRPSGCRR